jgi:hypothetical protein
MSKSLGKPLKGIAILPESVSNSLESSLSSVASGGVFNNIQVNSGVLDGATIGLIDPGPIYATTLTSGDADGSGYNVIFYSQNVGDSVYWNPLTSTWQIDGDLNVRDTTNLGNFRFTGNTISTTNTDGNIVLSPNGKGQLYVNSPITQTAEGNVSFSTQKTDFTITNITGNTITTSQDHLFSIGDKIRITGTNVDGNWTILSIPTSKKFTISTTGSGSSGSVFKHYNIVLDTDAYVVVDGGSMYLGSTLLEINNENISIDSRIPRFSYSLFDDNKDRGFSYNYISGITNKIGFFGYDISNDAFVFIKDATITNDVVSGAFGDAKFSTLHTNTINTISGSNLNIGNSINLTNTNPSLNFGSNVSISKSGDNLITNIPSPGQNIINANDTIINGNLTVSGVVNISSNSSSNLTTEHFTYSGSNINPSGGINETVVKITNTNITVNGTMPGGTVDGFIKKIIVVELGTNSKYILSFPANRLLGGDGLKIATNIEFRYAGQSITLTWNATDSLYTILSINAFVK